MCGFVGGFWNFDEARLASIQHRGPDKLSDWYDSKSKIFLGHARLAIIDVEGGLQPVWDKDQRFALLFNGEIYNYREIRSELQKLGHQFETDSDSEVLLKSYLEWREACLRKFRGMFAFAIYDKNEKSFFLARDPLGIKPLYYLNNSKEFQFASEIKALKKSLFGKLNFEAVYHYLVFGFTQVGQTTLENVLELPPGHFLIQKDEKISISKYWRWGESDFWPSSQPSSFEEAVELSEDLLVKELKDHLVADVSLGLFLSGGIDSSLLATLLSRRLNQNLSCYTVSFSDVDYDESSSSRALAEHLGLPHHVLHMQTSERLSFSELCERIGHFDVPFADSSALPTWEISKMVRQHHKVVIGGDGGDEVFGGYSRFQRFHTFVKWNRYISKGALIGLANVSRRFAPEQSRQFMKLSSALPYRWPESVFPFVCYMNPEEARSWLAPSVRDSAEVFKAPLIDFSSVKEMNEDPDHLFRRLTFERSLPGDYLRKVDMMSARHGLEVRVPFLGTRLVEFSYKLGREYLYDGAENKKISRKILAKHLPANLISQSKRGFGIPLDRYLTREHKEALREFLLGTDSRVRSVVDFKMLTHLVDQFYSDNRKKDELSRFSLYQRVYLFWSLEIHLRTMGL